MKKIVKSTAFVATPTGQRSDAVAELIIEEDNGQWLVYEDSNVFGVYPRYIDAKNAAFEYLKTYITYAK